GPDLLRRRLPALGPLMIVTLQGEVGAACCGHPAHHLRGGKVLRLAANLPDPLVRLVPVLESGLDETRQALPQRSGNLGGIAPELDVYRVQQHSPDVVLALVPCAVARPDGAGSPPSGQVVEGPLGELAL